VRYARYLHKRTILQKIAFHGKEENKVTKRTAVKNIRAFHKKCMQFVKISAVRFSDVLQFALIRIALNDIVSSGNNFDCIRGNGWQCFIKYWQKSISPCLLSGAT